ncbi:type II toxin-antitoxin system HicA family toxin [Halosimplex marinum]|uniref:type II toxin-antitoxin system HicA family toxin n=1 Tax=Halosimplex marinum TaxID=3396620 RepID=UPI003F543AB4
MSSRDYSGEDVYKGMMNSSVSWQHIRTTGDHVILKWDPPEAHSSDTRTVSIPLHDSLSIGTLDGIAEDAGADSLSEFCDWIESNC